MKMLKNAELLGILSNSNKDIFMWGHSNSSRQILNELNKNPKAFIDNNYETLSRKGINALSPKMLCNVKNSLIVISGNYCEQIYHQILSLNIDETNEVLFSYELGGDKILSNLLFFSENNSNLEIFTLFDYMENPQNYAVFYTLNHAKKAFMNATNLHISFLTNYINRDKIYIGCGEDYVKGYIHCDLRKLSHIDFACNAWEVSKHISNLGEIYTRHMLEHLTQDEGIYALKDWFRALKTGGVLHIIVPNFELRCKQFLSCEWEDFENKTQDEIWSVAGCWGWQRECDPSKENYNQTYWDVHKCGYTQKRITMVLKYVGFSDISTKVDEKNNLIAICYKRQ